MSETNTATPALDNTMGALYISVILSTALWAAATVQLYFYFNEYKRDRLVLRLLVAFVWFCDAVHLALFTMIPYYRLVTHYGQPSFLLSNTEIIPYSEIYVLLSGLICFLVQGFYAHRIWRLSNQNRILISFLILLICTEFGANTAFYIIIRPMTSAEQWLTVTWLAKTVASLDASSGVLLAGLVIFLLHSNRTGFRRTESMINRLIVLTINTGLLTSICAVLTLIFVIAQPDNYIYIAFYGNISKLYTNSLLATLNARDSLKATIGTDSGTVGSSIAFGHVIEGRTRSGGNKPITINVQTESHMLDDIESLHSTKD